MASNPDMEFIKYRHIPNVGPDEPVLDTSKKSRMHGATDEWVASEKVDGANFQFVVTAEDVVCCSRTMVLDADSNFYNFEKLAEKYHKSVRAVFKWCSTEMGYDEKNLIVRIYGELFGGFYPGVSWDWTASSALAVGSGYESMTASGIGANSQCDSVTASGTSMNSYCVTPNNNDIGINCVSVIAVEGEASGRFESVNAREGTISAAKINAIRVKPCAKGAVQKRIHYIPDIDYYLIDISYTRLDAEDEEKSNPNYLYVDELLAVASQCGFTYVARPLHRGTLSELCQLPREFLTTIPAQAGLPELPVDEAAGFQVNKSEGYVLRPLSQRKRDHPIRLKLKSADFLEFTNPGFAANRAAAVLAKKNKRSTAPRRKLRKALDLSEREQELRSHLLRGVNANRLTGVASKQEGNALRKMHDCRLASMLIEDALEEIIEDYADLSELFRDLDKVTLKRIKESVFEEALDIVEEERPGF